MSYKRSDLQLKYALHMPSVSDTAYPRFKINPSAKELNELYTPTVYELAFARERARQPLQRAGLLLLLKTFQRLGYFALCAETRFCPQNPRFSGSKYSFQKTKFNLFEPDE